MDSAGTGWYFSWMPAPAIRRVEFHATKYGSRLLVDAALLSDMHNFDQGTAPYRLNFYDILLVTRGHGWFALDDAVHKVRPGTVFFTRPGEVRRWDVKALDGACLFFAADFVHEAFNDPQFVSQFAFFAADRPSGALRLTKRQAAAFLRRFKPMRSELRRLRGDTGHLLRARLYELLILLNRWYVEEFGQPAAPRDHTVTRFMTLVERNYRRYHGVAAYAQMLGRTAGHLTHLCNRAFGHTAGAMIHQRLALEAKRLLLHTSATSAAIGYALGFEDPAYFSRSFRRMTGQSPSDYRAAGRRAR